MIALTPTTALMLYLGIALFGILFVWIFSHYKTRKQRFMPLEKELIVCEFCVFSYLDNTAKKITRCPRCASYNKKKT